MRKRIVRSEIETPEHGRWRSSRLYRGGFAGRLIDGRLRVEFDGFVGATRVDVHMDWIVQETGGNLYIDTGGSSGGINWGGKDSGGWCAAAPVWPGGLGLLLVPVGAVLLRRRRG